MKEMDDQSLDALIMETLERRETIEALNKSVMAEVRRSARRERRRLWARAAVFAFALPLLVFTFIYVVANGWYAGAGTSVAFACLAVQVAAVVAALWMILELFSFRDV